MPLSLLDLYKSLKMLQNVASANSKPGSEPMTINSCRSASEPAIHGLCCPVGKDFMAERLSPGLWGVSHLA